MEQLLPREAAKFIASKSQSVKICKDGIKQLGNEIFNIFKCGNYGLHKFKEHAQNPSVANASAIEWIFFADVLNFSFWADDASKKYMVRCRGEECTGYWSLCAAINRALDEGIPLTQASYFVNMSMSDWEKHFRSDSETEMPLKELRLKNLHEAGKVLMEKYDGSFVNVIKKCERSSQKLLQLIVTDFPSFRDTADFEGYNCAFYKRAQIVIADIWACFEGKGLGTFDDIDQITMFADYRIPQALAFFNALEYSDELMECLRGDHMMKTGDRYEVELRGCSIYAVELIRDECKRLQAAEPSLHGLVLNAVMIDHFLWDYRRVHAHNVDAKFPMHKIRCIYY